MKVLAFSTVCTLVLAGAAEQIRAADYVVKPFNHVEYKAVFGQVQSRELALARARIGGTVMALKVEEGTAVKAGDVIATIVDDKLSLHLLAMDARLKELHAQLDNAQTELKRGLSLVASGTVPKTQIDGLRTQVDVLTNQVSAAEADRAVITQQTAEGQVLAPSPGRILSVPVTTSSVVMPGETIARIAGGGYFLRLSLPERHASSLHVNDPVLVGNRGLSSDQTGMENAHKGQIVKIYPEMDAGHVLADAEVDGLGDYFVGERTRVWIPVDQRSVIAVPTAALALQHGIDTLKVKKSGSGAVDVAVVRGDSFDGPNGKLTEILSGIHAGDTVITP